MKYSQNRLAQIQGMVTEAMRRKDYDQCIELLKRANNLAPNNWGIIINIAQLLVSRYEFHAAEQYFEQAINVTKNEESICAIAVECYFNARQNDLAIKYLNRLISRNSKSFEALTFLATIYERQGFQIQQTSELVDQALRLNSGYTPALLIKTRILRKEGLQEDAEKILRKITSNPDPDINIQAESWCELGKMLDGQSRYEEAISAFMVAKNLLIPHSTKLLEERHITQAHSRLMGDFVSQETLKRWHDDGSTFSQRRSIALLGGHPRSGTTLMEQILDAHPEVVSVEESAIFFNEAYLPIVQNTILENHLKVLSTATSQQLTKSRDRYFTLVERFLGVKIGGSLLIDKNPSLTQFIPAMVKIFPECKFLIALRDPRDVCLSCFMQYLPNSPVTSTYLTLQETVNEYVSVMQTWESVKQKIPNSYLEIRYEELVNDVEPLAHKILEFLEIPWDSRILDFNQHANSKTVYSPTYADVIKPIYKGAVGRWKNYQKYFEPYLNQLEPLVKAFGYE